MKSKFVSTIPDNLVPYKLPKNWKWFFWEDIMQSYQQGMIRSNNQLGNGNVEYLKMGDIDSTGSVNLTDLKLTSASEEEILNFKLKNGDFLINVRNSLPLVGKTCVIDNVDDRKILYNHMLVRIDNGSVDMNYYINAFLNIPSSKKLIDRIKEGTTTVIALYQRELNKLPIALPDDLTFKKIVEIYKNLRLKIEVNNKINQELESMAKTLYDYWFVQFDFPNADGKPYKSSGGKMVYNKTLKREIPEGWEVKELQILSDCIMGQSPKSETYNNEGKGLPLLNGPADYENGILVGRTYTTEPTRICDKNDLVLCIRATIGNLVYAEKEFCLGRGVAAVRPKEEKFSELIYYFLLQEIERFKIQATGSIIVGITKNDLIESKFLLPNEDLINLFHKKIKPIFDKIRLNKLENQELSSLRDWLLPMLMNGQVSVGE